MDRGLRLVVAMDSIRPQLEALANSIFMELTESEAAGFFREGFRRLWLVSRSADSCQAISLHLMFLIGSSPRDLRWRYGGVGRMLLAHLNFKVRILSEKLAHEVDSSWDEEFWLLTARIYLSCLCQSHTLNRVFTGEARARTGLTETEDDGQR